MSSAVKDVERVKTPSVLRLIFFRNEENSSLSVLFWIKLLFFEILFGEEMLDNLVITSSYNNTAPLTFKGEVKDSGWNRQIAYHIPNGILNNWFKSQITEMMYYKFYKQYLILETSDNATLSNNIVDISETDFKASKERLHQFMELKKLYNCIGATCNIVIDSVVYLVSKRIDIALLSAVVIEYIRKIRF